MSEVTVCCKDKATVTMFLCYFNMSDGNDGMSLPTQAACVSVTHCAPPFDREAWSHSGFTLCHTCTFIHMFQFFHNLSSSLILSFFFNSSLFSAHVYFYPSVHGRSHRNDEAWETCSSPWQLYCKPSLSNIGFSSMLYTFVALILLSDLFRSIFHTVSSPDAQWSPPPSQPPNECLPSWILISPRCPPLTLPLPPGADWAVFSSLNQWACCCRVMLY